MSFHESIQIQRVARQVSNRSFGLKFSLIFFLCAVWPWLRYGGEIRIWLVYLSFILAIVAIIADKILSPLNVLWFKLGLMMHSVVSPIIIGVLFYGAVTPLAIIMRVFRQDLLDLKWTGNESYWIKREPPGPKVGSMKKQY